MDTQAIILTPKAVQKVLRLRANHPSEKAAYLRSYIIGGGCAGFEYGFSFDDKANADDFQFDYPVEQDVPPVTLLVDAMSYQYLQGSTIDFEETLQGARFKVDNPQADTTCGCGASFSVKEG